MKKKGCSNWSITATRAGLSATVPMLDNLKNLGFSTPLADIDRDDLVVPDNKGEWSTPFARR